MTRKGYIFQLIIIFLYLFISINALAFQPVNGIVTNPSGKNIVVRKTPPDASAFKYELGEKICSIGVGTTFKALDDVTIINGEIWYRISTTNIVNGKDCNEKISGWIVGKLKTGWAITLNPSEQVKETLPTSQSGIEEVEQSNFGFIARYILLLVGSTLAIVLFSIEKKQSLKFSDWWTPVVALEIIIFGLANIAFTMLMLDAFIKQSKETVVGSLFGALAGPEFGYLVIGFILSAILLRFASFTRQ